jgi:hypothetical protein
VAHPESLAEYRRGYDIAHSDTLASTGSATGDSVAEQDGAMDESAEIRRDEYADGAPSPNGNGTLPASAEYTSPAAASAAATSDEGPDETETEALRQAMLHYRVFFEDLLGRPQQTVAP